MSDNIQPESVAQATLAHEDVHALSNAFLAALSSKTTQYNEVVSELTKATMQLAELQRELDVAAQRLRRKDHDCKELESKLDETTRNLVSSCCLFEDLQNRMVGLQSSQSAATTEHVAPLVAQIKTLEETVASLRTINLQLRLKVEQMEKAHANAAITHCSQVPDDWKTECEWKAYLEELEGRESRAISRILRQYEIVFQEAVDVIQKATTAQIEMKTSALLRETLRNLGHNPDGPAPAADPAPAAAANAPADPADPADPRLVSPTKEEVERLKRKIAKLRATNDLLCSRMTSMCTQNDMEVGDLQKALDTKTSENNALQRRVAELEEELKKYRSERKRKNTDDDNVVVVGTSCGKNHRKS